MSEIQRVLIIGAGQAGAGLIRDLKRTHSYLPVGLVDDNEGKYGLEVHGVRVLGISPGLVLTERLEKLLKQRALDKFGNADQWQELTHNAPFHRTAAVDEIAASAVFLASSRSSYTSGAVLSIDGGFVRRHNWWG